MTNSLVRELGGYGITVDCMRPGMVAREVARGVAAVHPTGNDPHGPVGIGRFGLEEYLEVKSVYGFGDEAQALPTLFG
jgi:aldehyde dehydrogenase (NAD+)